MCVYLLHRGDDGVFQDSFQEHGAGLEAVPVHPDGLLADFAGTFFCEPRADEEKYQEVRKRDLFGHDIRITDTLMVFLTIVSCQLY